MIWSAIPKTSLFIAFLCVGNALTYGLWRHSANEFANYKAEVEAAGAAQKAHVEDVVQTQKQITEDTTNGWKAALDYVRADYARRVREQSGAGSMPGISKPAASLDGLPANALPLAEQCAETTLQLITLQNWVHLQEKVK